MGHIRLGNLPRTRNWQQVVQAIGERASIQKVATATLSASKRGLEGASQDIGLRYSMWLLTQVAQASRQSDFISSLRQLGLSVPDEPTFHDIVGCFSDAVDERLRHKGVRTDLGEMAQLAAVESLTKMCATQLDTFFDTTAEDVKASIRQFSTTRGFSQLSHEFFSRLIFRYMSYFLSRELSNHVGANRRSRGWTRTNDTVLNPATGGTLLTELNSKKLPRLDSNQRHGG